MISSISLSFSRRVCFGRLCCTLYAIDALTPVLGFYLFLASVHSTALGVLMAVSPVVWYPFYKTTTPAFGIDPLADQQLAGYIMWMPACMIYAAVAVTLFAAVINDCLAAKLNECKATN